MKRWTLFPLGLAALLPSVGVPSLSHAQTETGGVAPTAPQAEDRPDVGDSPDAPATPPPAPLKKQLDIPWDDSTFRGRYEAYQEAVEAFETEAREAREQIRQIGERKYKERRAKVESNFKRQLDPTLEAERGRRVEAIAAFQAFLAQHPEDHEYAPDAIFRLAELYYERTDDEFQQAQAAWKLAYQAWKEQGGQGAPPAEPTRRFDETVALYQRLIANYPEYRFIDGAYYLLGYTLRAQGDTAP